MTEAVELGDVVFTVAVVVRHPPLVLAVCFPALLVLLVAQQRALGVVLRAERHERVVLTPVVVQLVLLEAFRTLVLWEQSIKV